MTVDRVGHLNTILARWGGNLNDLIFKSSNARGLPRGGGGMLKFRVDRRITLWEVKEPVTAGSPVLCFVVVVVVVFCFIPASLDGDRFCLYEVTRCMILERSHPK